MLSIAMYKGLLFKLLERHLVFLLQVGTIETYLLSLEVGYAEQHLHYRVEIATVSKVTDTRIARAIQWFQLHPRLLNQLPLPNPLVHINL